MFVIDPVLLSQTAEEMGGLQVKNVELMNTVNTDNLPMDAIACLLQTELHMGELDEQADAESLKPMLIIHLWRQNCVLLPKMQHRVAGLSVYKLKRVLNYIHSNLDQQIQLAELAEICSMSQYYFCRLFKQSIGVAPYKYVLQQRMEKAKQLLQQRKYAIAEIALMVGCADQSHFTKTFKRYTGVTPRYFAENSVMVRIF